MCVCLWVCIYCVCAIFVFHQFQNTLSQTTEQLHWEVAQRQQLSEEFEQVAAMVDALVYLLVFSHQRVTTKRSVNNIGVFLCVVNL